MRIHWISFIAIKAIGIGISPLDVLSIPRACLQATDSATPLQLDNPIFMSTENEGAVGAETDALSDEGAFVRDRRAENNS